MNWFAQNWDKILGLFISVILAGVIGFFSAMFVLQDRIGELEERLVVIEGITIPTIESNGKQIGDIAGRVQELDAKFIALQAQSSLLISQNQIMLQVRVQGGPVATTSHR